MWNLRRKSGGNIRDFEKTFSLQEVRWKAQGAKMIGNGFKSAGCKAKKNDVGVIAASWLIGKLVGVERFNDGVMKDVVFGRYILLFTRS